MKSWKRNTLVLASTAFVVIGGVGFAQLEISRSTIDGGGVMRSTAGIFELSGTIGQPDAGVLINGSLTLTGGFWFGTPPGDSNEDGKTGLADLSAFAGCLLGPAGSPPVGPCRSLDVNASGEVDLMDFAEIQENFGG
jgi:hypothetical protein